MAIDLEPLRQELKTSRKLSLAIRVIPKSSRTEWAGQMADGSYKVKLAAVPEKGKANVELIRFLASEFDINRNAVEIVAGETNPHKQIRITL